jgi:hypothetical protein
LASKNTSSLASLARDFIPFHLTPFYIFGQLFSVLASKNPGLLASLASVLKNLSTPLLVVFVFCAGKGLDVLCHSQYQVLICPLLLVVLVLCGERPGRVVPFSISSPYLSIVVSCVGVVQGKAWTCCAILSIKSLSVYCCELCWCCAGKGLDVLCYSDSECIASHECDLLHRCRKNIAHPFYFAPVGFTAIKSVLEMHRN